MELAVRAMCFRAGVSAVSLVITIVQRDSIKRKVLEDAPHTSQSAIDAALTVGIVIGVLILLLYLALAARVRAGRNWARVTTWVFAALGVLGLLGSFAQATVGSARVLNVVDGLLDLVIIVLLALAPSNAWFRSGGTVRRSF